MLGLSYPLSRFSAVLGSVGRAGKTLTYLLGRSDPQEPCVSYSGAVGGGELAEVRIREYSGNPGRKQKPNPDLIYLSL